MAGQNAVGYMEMSCHRLVVGHALGIIAFHNALDLVRSHDCLLFHHLLVTDETEDDIWGNNGETGYLIVGEEFV